MEAYSDAGFTTLIASSETFNATPSTLTVNGLTTNVQYFFRVGAFNWNGVVNYLNLGSATTGAGPAPTNPIITSVFVSSIAVTWGSVSSLSGYSLEASTGSLGLGLSLGLGMALGVRLDSRPSRIYVMLGDGESQEGQIWESLQGAANRELGEITVIVDNNKIQSDTWVTDVSDLGDIESAEVPAERGIS